MKDSIKTVLVTGGSRGIGAAITKILSEDGITVYAASRSGNVPEGLKNVVPLSLDINDEQGLSEAVRRIVSERGSLDAVVCNAGNGVGGAIEDTSDEEAKYQFETCFFGTAKTIRACLPIFREQGRGRIITVTSVAAFIPIPYQAYYSSAKAAALMLTRALYIEAKEFGIQCCSILPGDVRTGFTSARKKVAAFDSSAYKRAAPSIKKMERDEQRGMDSSTIAKAVRRQLRKRKMSLTVVPRLDYKTIRLLVRILPEKLVLFVVGLLYNRKP